MEHLLCEPTAGGECNVCGIGIFVICLMYTQKKLEAII